jgi:hypothetical protein
MAKIKFEFVNGKIREIELPSVDNIKIFVDKCIIDKKWFTIVDKEGKGIAIALSYITNIQID